MGKSKNRPLSVLFKVTCTSFCVMNILAGVGIFRVKSKFSPQKASTPNTDIKEGVIQLLINAHDGMQLSTTLFATDNPTAIVQILHGATEHKELYYEFADYLQKNGYAIIISDYRGHGKTVSTNYPYGHMNSVDELIEDAYSITEYFKKVYPDKPLYILGHSLGSILARCYLQIHPIEVEKLIMTGTIKPIAYLPMKFWLFIGNWATFFFGTRRHSKLLHIVGGSTIYKSLSYEENFVTTDKEIFEKLSADPLMHFTWTNKGALTMLEAVSRLKHYKKYSALNPTLKILSLSGTMDPLTGGNIGLKETTQMLRKSGYSDILIKQYEGKLHSILLETNRNQVYKDIVGFFTE